MSKTKYLTAAQAVAQIEALRGQGLKKPAINKAIRSIIRASGGRLEFRRKILAYAKAGGTFGDLVKKLIAWAQTPEGKATIQMLIQLLLPLILGA